MAEWYEGSESLSIAVRADTSEFQQQIADAARLGRQFGNVLTSAFDGIAIKGKGVSDVLRSLALSLSQLVLRAALRPLTGAIGNAMSGLVGGIGFAHGGVISQRLPVPFADGGVIASPVSFPLAGGRMGLAGERGAEAIMPLARGPDGRLGVAAQGAGGGMSITFNVTTPDADSFRRSEAQIAAMLARAAALGQRNM